MNVVKTLIPDVLILEPCIHEDDRGLFFESYNKKKFEDLTGAEARFVQDNHSVSRRHVLRGLHYQINRPQGKLVRVIKGAVYDVAVDLRRSSPTFGSWVGQELSAVNRKQLWIPEGFAHGFVVLSKEAEFVYKVSNYYEPEYERCIRWDDQDLAIDWQEGNPIVSERDRNGANFRNAEVFE